MLDLKALLESTLTTPPSFVREGRLGDSRAGWGFPPSATEAPPQIAIAVSGGPDSLALLILAHAAWPGRITALTVDHALRPESATEAAGVARQCSAHGIPHFTLQWTGAKPAANLQAAARAARYALMAEYCARNAIPILLTAHHADDQAETLLMRLARGSGAAGLAGIRPWRILSGGVTLARPLLGVRREKLTAIVAAAGWTPITDPGNDDPRFTRTHARRLLAAAPWLDVPQMAQAAAHAAEIEAALAWATDRAWHGAATTTPSVAAPGATHITLDTAGLPETLRHRLAARAIAVLDPDATPRGPDLARLTAALDAGRTVTLAGVRIAAKNTLWHFKPAAARRPMPTKRRPEPPKPA